MPDTTTTVIAADLLSPRCLEEAAADPRREWSVDALCVTSDLDIFFPPGDDPAMEARQICADCPVRGQCLAYAVAADEPFGIWGGLDTQERRTLRRLLQRRETAASAVRDRTA
jgi:WhiB family transcriptional regulator, redox-sensing transcriptional regulator